MIKRWFYIVKESAKAHKIFNVALIVCLSLYIFSIPAFSGRPTWNYISYGLMILTSVITIAEYVFYEKFVFDRRLLIFFVFVIEALVGTIIHYPHDIRHWISVVLVFLSLVVFYYAFICIKDKKLIFKMIAYSMLVFGFYFTYKYYDKVLTFSISSKARYGWDFDNVNTVGSYFSLGAIIFLYLGAFFDKKRELLYLIPGFFLLYLGLFTGSRQFLLTTFLAAYLVFVFSLRKRKWIAFVALAAFIAIFIGILQIPKLADYKDQFERAIATIFDTGKAKIDPSVIERVLWPRNGFALGSKEFFFGYGVEGFSYYSGLGTYSHNNYSEVFCNFGVLGLIIFYVGVLYPALLAIRSKDKSLRMVIVVVVFYLTRGLFGVYYYSKDAYLMFGLMLYMVKDIKLGKFIDFNIGKAKIETQSIYEVSI